MEQKYKLLDLYCKAGGAGMGYYSAGFDVTGIDIEPQKHYPFKFIQSDAIEYVKRYGYLYDAIHASPPCQEASRSTAQWKAKGKKYPDLIPLTRVTLKKFDVPVIIENVPDAMIRPDIKLRGYMFNLKVIRERLFEIHNCFILQAGIPQKNGSVRAGDYACVFGKGSYRKNKLDQEPKFKKTTVRETWAYAMGIESLSSFWNMSDIELAEAIPPAYTEYIGKQVLNYLKYQNENT